MLHRYFYRLAFFWLALPGLLAGCVYQNEEDLFPEPEPQEQNGCVTGEVSYALTVQPILQQKCYTCHAISFHEAGVIMEGYANVKSQATSGRLLGAISHAPGFHPMPKNGAKLPDCDIVKIKKWIEAGAKDN